MQQRRQIYILAGLIVILVVVLLWARRGPVSALAGRSPLDVKFEPLDVKEPQLRVDLITTLQKQIYTGSERNIFVGAPPPPPVNAPKPPTVRQHPNLPTGPNPPAPPPPLDVSGIQLFGYEFNPASGERFGFFLNGDDVVVAAEGDTLLSRFRLLRIGDDSADVEEISTGRHASVAMVQPAADQGQGTPP